MTWQCVRSAEGDRTTWEELHKGPQFTEYADLTLKLDASNLNLMTYFQTVKHGRWHVHRNARGTFKNV